jgi:16S rRNA (adenine1518-N6/adenine1519-N6)-dimethyltransferase
LTEFGSAEYSLTGENMNIDTNYTLRKYNLRPTKSLGQNFLTDPSILSGIADAAGLTKDDMVLEIGPGLGSLTVELAKSAGLVVAVEIDRRLIPVLKDNLKDFPNITIVNGDILQIDIEKELSSMAAAHGKKLSEMPLKIAANLPYYITTPVIMKLLESGIKAKTMVFMVQKEVAGRMCASPGGKDYGALSIAVQYYSKPRIVMEVPPHYFIPKPDVDSTVIRLDLPCSPCYSRSCSHISCLNWLTPEMMLAQVATVLGR